MDRVPRLSVVIPHLNEADNLRRCLRSLVADRAGDLPFEIIVVDNGSRESPQARCADFVGVRFALEAEPGPGPARNLGARLARSDIIAFIDADCVVEPGWAHAIMERMTEDP